MFFSCWANSSLNTFLINSIKRFSSLILLFLSAILSQWLLSSKLIQSMTYFLERGRSFFLYIVFPFQSYYVESKCTAVYMSPHKSTMREENICIKVLVIEVKINIVKIFCHSRQFFVLHLLVKSAIPMTIVRKAVERVFILIQFFSYLGKQRGLSTCPWL